MSRHYYIEGITKPRGVHNADYGAVYDRTYKDYSFQNRASAVGFAHACGYEAFEVREEIGSAAGVGWQGTVTVYRRLGKPAARLYDIDID